MSENTPPPVQPVLTRRTRSGDEIKYELGDRIGKGGFGSVYFATERPTNRPTAIKCIWKNHFSDPKVKQRLITEIEIHRSLSHRYIVEFYCVFQDSDYVYFVLEYCPGGNVLELLKKNPPFSENQTADIVRQILESLVYLHHKNIIHHDIKLQNFLIDSQNNVKLCDFGLSIRITEDTKSTISGTPGYIPPEVIFSKEKPKTAIDIWSMGVAVFLMLTGKQPFQTHDKKETFGRIKNVRYVWPAKAKSTLSEAAQNFVSSVLKKTPEERPTARDLLHHPFILNFCSCYNVKRPVKTIHSRTKSLYGASMFANNLDDNFIANRNARNHQKSNNNNENSKNTENNENKMEKVAIVKSVPRSISFLGGLNNVNSFQANNCQNDQKHFNHRNIKNKNINDNNETNNENGKEEVKPDNDNNKHEANINTANTNIDTNNNNTNSNTNNDTKISSTNINDTKINSPDINNTNINETNINKTDNNNANVNKAETNDNKVYINSSMKISQNTISSVLMSLPKYTVRIWWDYSTKYGLAYLLHNGTCGACFNDATRMVLEKNETYVQYYESPHAEKMEVISLLDNLNLNLSPSSEVNLQDNSNASTSSNADKQSLNHPLIKKLLLIQHFAKELKTRIDKSSSEEEGYNHDNDSDSDEENSQSDSFGVVGEKRRRRRSSTNNSNNPYNPNNQNDQNNEQLASHKGHKKNKVVDTTKERQIPMGHVKYWARTKEGVLFRFANRDIQANFKDHTKLVIESQTKDLYFDDTNLINRLNLVDLSDRTKNHEVRKRFRIVKEMANHLI